MIDSIDQEEQAMTPSFILSMLGIIDDVPID